MILKVQQLLASSGPQDVLSEEHLETVSKCELSEEQLAALSDAGHENCGRYPSQRSPLTNEQFAVLRDTGLTPEQQHVVSTLGMALGKHALSKLLSSKRGGVAGMCVRGAILLFHFSFS